jgi:hypothetical protein
MKRIIPVLIILMPVITGKAVAQVRTSFALLAKKEDSLKILAGKMINALDGNERYEACMQFIPHLVNTLKTPYSFAYPFDSIKEVSIVYPEDSSFRIFTWAITTTNAAYRFYGAMQMRTPDGSLKLFPFFDNSQFTRNMDTITSNKAWIGALYYNMITTQYGGRTFYTLLGWHGYNFRSNEKLLDVLTFEKGKPVFGAPVFNFENDSIPGKIRNRFLLIYKRDGNAGLNYDPDKKMIIFDHLVPLNGQPQEKYTLVPDGTYEGFKWEKGYWVHVPRIFHTVSDKPPLPVPVKFKKNIQEKDMMQQDK